MFWCVLVRSLCSLLDLHSPGIICDVVIWYSFIPVVAPGFRKWASAYCVLLQVLLHAHIGLVTFPCLWRRCSFPHSLPFCATGTASTLTVSWSRWSLVTLFPVAAGFGIWLDWPIPTPLHIAVLGATVCNEDAEANRWVASCRRIIGMTPSGIEPANFQLVAQCHNQLRYRCWRSGTGSKCVVSAVVAIWLLRIVPSLHKEVYGV